MRPGADTAVASIVNRPALDCNICPQCTVCQSVAQPLTAEYWHIGDTTMRLARTSLRKLKGENSAEGMGKYELVELASGQNREIIRRKGLVAPDDSA
jgi:hypothetical protein